MAGFSTSDQLGRGLTTAAVCVVLAEAISEYIVQAKFFLGYEATPLGLISQYNIHNTADACCRRYLNRRPKAPGDNLGLDLVNVVFFA